jgi:hypothetical protein
MTMTFDLISTVILTAGAAIVIATLAIGFGNAPAQRIRLAAMLGGWFALVTAFAATGLFYFGRGPLAAPGLGLSVAAPLIILALAVLRTASLRARLAEIALPTLIGVHAVRILGVLFVALYAQNRLPAPFAPMAGWGDVFVGLTALPVAWLVAQDHPASRPVAQIWNLIGMADLLDAVALGVTSSPGPAQLIFGDVTSAIMSQLPWLFIPGFLVPLLFSTHLAIAWRLHKSGSAMLPTGAHRGRTPAMS